MPASFTAELTRRARERGLSSSDAPTLAAAIVAGWNEQREAVDGQTLFRVLADRIPGDDHGSGLAAARDWLGDPGLSSIEWDWVEDSLRFLQHHASGPIDWNAEVSHCLAPDARGGSINLSLPLARSVARVIDLPLHGSVGCIFSATASIAWILAEEHEVTLYADQAVAIIAALLARAACRPLKVRRENPLNGSFMPAPYGYVGSRRGATVERFDHLVSVPPFGFRMQDGPVKGVPFESYQIEQLAARAGRSFVSLVPDGILFREAKTESQLRAELISQHRVTVLSLPSGMFWPASALLTSLLRLDPGPSQVARMVDGRTMAKSSIGRSQENLIALHLEEFRRFRPEDPARMIDVPIDELADNGFSLLPERYIKSKSVAALERALEQRPVAALSDVAEIERGKAPLPLRDVDEDPPLTALEIVPADLVDGVVRAPSRQQAFDLTEKVRVRGVTVRPGDILVSIKGSVGIVGIVDDMGATLAEQMGEPWIVSQSLAIIRLKPNGAILSAAVLNALLTAPWLREKLESMSGATTVRTLPMNALRSLTLPVPSPEECAHAETKLAEIAIVRKQIIHHQRNLAESQRQLWAQLWHVPQDIGDE
ncbi:MAG: hypothetical protein JWO81_769 [Alphaproteobacteria bacterium]|nr:hypothetical protein [Alphaproteobacteria bacterium]